MADLPTKISLDGVDPALKGNVLAGMAMEVKERWLASFPESDGYRYDLHDTEPLDDDDVTKSQYCTVRRGWLWGFRAEFEPEDAEYASVKVALAKSSYLHELLASVAFILGVIIGLGLGYYGFTETDSRLKNILMMAIGGGSVSGLVLYLLMLGLAYPLRHSMLRSPEFVADQEKAKEAMLAVLVSILEPRAEGGSGSRVGEEPSENRSDSREAFA